METAREKKLTISNIQSASLRSWWDGALKRAFDILVSAPGLVVLSPFFLLIAVFIKRKRPAGI
jgi:lipopolysaccharide/colanic/teichoic acid biosynthesis glycosyltransferase